MNKKYILIGLIIVALLGAYFYFYKLTTPPGNNNIVDEKNETSEMKIDINAVCDGALAYMTFPDGESAAKFVLDCKEGKHPEVIEKFKADMNLGADAAI